MNAISIRRIEPGLHAWLREQASAHGVSMEEEVRNLLRAARDAAEARRRAEEQAAWQALFALAYKPPPGSPDSVTLLREDRDGH
jgi:plasmid stability protein